MDSLKKKVYNLPSLLHNVLTMFYDDEQKEGEGKCGGNCGCNC